MALDPAIVSHLLYWLWICHQPAKKKTPGPLIAHKEKLREDLNRGNSIAFVLFFVFPFFVFGSPNILFVWVCSNNWNVSSLIYECLNMDGTSNHLLS